MATTKRKGTGTTTKRVAKRPRAATAPRKFDAALRRQLGEGGRIEAVVQLRGPRAAGGFATAQDTADLAQRTLRAAERASGRRASAWHVFRNLSAFVVSGPAELIRGFAQLEVVRAVVANRQPALAPIAPVRSRAVQRPRPARRRATASSRGARGTSTGRTGRR